MRLPDERTLKLMREQRAHGVLLHADIMPSRASWAHKLGIQAPRGSMAAAGRWRFCECRSAN